MEKRIGKCVWEVLQEEEEEELSRSGEGTKKCNAWQKAGEALLKAFRFSPPPQSKRLFPFSNNKFNLLKSLVRRVAPSKDGRRSLSREKIRAEVRRSEQGSLRIYDIVRWNSLEESEFLDIYASHSSRSLVRAKESSADMIFSSLERKVEDLSFSSISRASNSPAPSSPFDCSPTSCFSLEMDRNGGPADFHHSPRFAVNMISIKPQMCDALCICNPCVQKHHTLPSSSSIAIPLEVDDVTSADDVNSDSTYIEEGSENENPEEEEEVEQLSPISVLDSTSTFQHTMPTIHRCRKDVRCEYEEVGVVLEEKNGREEWKRFSLEMEEIGIKIEVAIFRVLLKELLLDLLAF